MHPEIKIITGIKNAPIYEQVKALFEIDDEHTIITYGDTIFQPHELPPDLIVHESVHCKQQGYNQADASNWWDQYLHDPEFRLSQELEAYREQYAFLKKHIKDRNKLFLHLRKLAQDLSGPTYGNIIGAMTALQEIRKGV